MIYIYRDIGYIYIYYKVPNSGSILAFPISELVGEPVSDVHVIE